LSKWRLLGTRYDTPRQSGGCGWGHYFLLLSLWVLVCFVVDVARGTRFQVLGNTSTEMRPVLYAEGILISNLTPIVLNPHPRFEIGHILLLILAHEGRVIAGYNCQWVVLSGEQGHSSLRVNHGVIDDIRHLKNITGWLSSPVAYCKHIHGWTSAKVGYVGRTLYRASWAYGVGYISSPDPSSLIGAGEGGRGPQGLARSSLVCQSRQISQISLPRIVDLGFTESAHSGISRTGRSARGLLRNNSLPNAYTDRAECGEYKSSSEPRKTFIGFNLRAGEFMLLACASVALCLFFIFRGIKNDVSPFAMEGVLAIILFLIGQLFVYLTL
jgi:hypothetical protein